MPGKLLAEESESVKIFTVYIIIQYMNTRGLKVSKFFLSTVVVTTKYHSALIVQAKIAGTKVLIFVLALVLALAIASATRN